MPEAAGSSWADEIEEGDVTTLPPSSEKVKGDIKMVTDYSFNEDGKKVKTVRSYKMERKMVPKVVAERRAWHKFGMSKDDKQGPNPQVARQALVFHAVTYHALVLYAVMFHADPCHAAPACPSPPPRPRWWPRRSGCPSWPTSRSTRRARRSVRSLSSLLSLLSLLQMFLQITACSDTSIL